jgi:hypothetical protein
MFNVVNVMTQENTYDTTPGNHANGKAIDQTSKSTPPPYSTPLQTEKPISNVVLHPPKGTIRKVTSNPNALATEN